MKVCVIGLGYIGLPTALLFAQKHVVVGVDINIDIIDKLSKGILPLEEPGLKELFIKAGKNFTAKTRPEKSDVFLIAVPTPLEKSVKVADLSFLRAAAESITPHLSKGNLVIIESTIPPGTCERLIMPILEGSTEGEINLVHCPERAIPGKTIEEMINNDRIIGADKEKTKKQAQEIYSSFVKGKIFLTNIRTAEFVKLMENTYRDVNIALANEFAQMAEDAGINVWEAIELANKHPRVDILKPGPGVGGHCIAIDPWFLTEASSKYSIVSLAREINDSMPNHVLRLVRGMLRDIPRATITVLGVAYKANISDTRETPAYKFIKLAENEGLKVKIHDPHITKFERKNLNLSESLEDSDCIIILTDHKEFRNISPEEAGKQMKTKNIIDTRNFIDKKSWLDAGFVVKILGEGKT